MNSTVTGQRNAQHRPSRRPGWRGVWVAVLLFFVGFTQALRADDAPAKNPLEGKTVIFLYSYSVGFGVYEKLAAGISRAVTQAGGKLDAVHHEVLDLARYNSPEYRRALKEILRAKYGGRKIDAIITSQVPALEFALGDFADFFGDSPVIAALLPEEPPARLASPRLVRMPYDADFAGTVQQAVALFPRTKRVVFVSGASVADNDAFRRQARAAFEPWSGKLLFEFLDDGDYERILARVPQLPADSIIICSTYYTDRLNRPRSGKSLAQQLAKIGTAPVFGLWDTWLGTGIMGGSMFDLEAKGMQAGQAVIDLLSGRKTLEQLRMLPIETGQAMYDWGVVQRWEARIDTLPAATRFVNRPLGVWETHRTTTFWTLAAFAVLLLFIAALMVQRRMRGRVELALAESESRFRLLFQRAPVALFTDDGTRITQMNDRLIELCGYDSDEVGPLNAWFERLYPDPVERHRNQENWTAAVARARALKRPFVDPVEHRITRKNGEVRTVMISALTVGRENLAMFYDISERKRIEEILQQHRENLEQLVVERTRELVRAKGAAESASLAKSAFLSNMSHELRTPLNAIMGMTLLAQRRAVDAEQRQQIASVESASQHLITIIDDILDISNIEAGHLTIYHEPLDLTVVLEKMLNLVGSRAAEKHLRLEVDMPPQLSRQGYLGDPLRLEQILINLVSNAIKFTEAGTVQVRARCIEETAQSMQVRFEVEDHGIGIAGEHQERIFNTFEQGDALMTKRYGGAGLGLAICKRLIELMGGEIGCESVVGQGSTFWFELRLIKSPGKRRLIERPARNAAAELRLHYAGKRVLVVEDEPYNQYVSRELLEEAGLVVCIAEDGLQALEQARLKKFDLILMDLRMPNMSGLDATRAIRAESKNLLTPIVAMTAYAYEEDRQTCFAAGMDDHVAKPIQGEQLCEVVLTWLEKGISGRHDDEA